MDRDPAIEATPLSRLIDAIHGQERFIALIGEGGGDVVAAAVGELEPAVGFVHLSNVPASPLTLERILSEIGGHRAASPGHELASAGDSLATRAGARRRIVLILDQAQNLSADALLFLQALPHSTLRDRPTLKILFVADARFWALVGSERFTGIRERSAEPIILDGQVARRPAQRLRPAAAALPLEPAAPASGSEADFVPISNSSTGAWRRPACVVAGLVAIAASIAVLVPHSSVLRSGTGTASGGPDAPAGVASPPANSPAAGASQAVIEVAPAVTQPAVPTPDNPAVAGAAPPDDLRQRFNDFLSGRGLSHLSDAQRDRLFRQYLASRGMSPAAGRADAGR